MQSNDKTYWSREIADLLDIGSSTLRKWCLLLEQNGYLFLRDEHERRAFTEHDAIALRKLKDLTKDKGMTLENAVIAVISTHNRNQNEERTLSATPTQTRYEERFSEWEGKMDLLLSYLSDREKEYKEIRAQNERLHDEITALRSDTSSKLETISQQIETVITESRSERHRKKWFQFWK